MVRQVNCFFAIIAGLIISQSYAFADSSLTCTAEGGYHYSDSNSDITISVGPRRIVNINLGEFNVDCLDGTSSSAEFVMSDVLANKVTCNYKGVIGDLLIEERHKTVAEVHSSGASVENAFAESVSRYCGPSIDSECVSLESKFKSSSAKLDKAKKTDAAAKKALNVAKRHHKSTKVIKSLSITQRKSARDVARFSAEVRAEKDEIAKKGCNGMVN